MNDIIEVVSEYISSVGKDHAVTADFYEVPAFAIGPLGMRLMQTKADVVEFLDGMIAAIKPEGYTGSTREYISVKMLTSHVALCSAISARRRVDGTEIERIAAAYLLKKNGDCWKIRQLIRTDPENVF